MEQDRSRATYTEEARSHTLPSKVISSVPRHPQKPPAAAESSIVLLGKCREKKKSHGKVKNDVKFSTPVAQDVIKSDVEAKILTAEVLKGVISTIDSPYIVYVSTKGKGVKRTKV